MGLQGVLLKMASESEGLRLGEVLTRATLDGLLKMASESEGLRLRVLDAAAGPIELKMASESEGLRQGHAGNPGLISSS